MKKLISFGLVLIGLAGNSYADFIEDGDHGPGTAINRLTDNEVDTDDVYYKIMSKKLSEENESVLEGLNGSKHMEACVLGVTTSKNKKEITVTIYDSYREVELDTFILRENAHFTRSMSEELRESRRIYTYEDSRSYVFFSIEYIKSKNTSLFNYRKTERKPSLPNGDRGELIWSLERNCNGWDSRGLSLDLFR